MKKKVDLKKKGKVTVLSSVILADVEEGDSGIDANSQGSCSSTDAKNAAAAARVVAPTQIVSSNKKDKKKKGKEVAVEVKTTSTKLTTNSAATQTNTAKVNSSQTKSNKVGINKIFYYYNLILNFIFRKRKIKSIQQVNLLLVQHLPPKLKLYLK